MKKLTRRKMMAWLSASLLGPLAYAANIAAQVTAAQVQNERGRTRIFIDTNHKIAYRYFTLANPHRLVIDLDGIHQNLPLTRLAQQIDKQHPLIKNIRIGQQNAKTLRLVIDLKQPAKVVVTATPLDQGNKQRIYIELAGSGSNSTESSAQNDNPPHEDAIGSLIQQQTPSAAQKQPAPQANRRTRKPVIMLDPGHGGVDPGAIGPGGVKEKDVAFAVALAAQSQLKAKGYIVHMTRTTDVKIPLLARRQKARQVNADLFISIHANSAEGAPTARGADVYIWGHANSERVRRLAKSENDADLVDGLPSVGNKDVDTILSDMMQSQTTADSTRLGSLILRNISGKVKLHRSQVDTANFLVLRSLDIPSVLLEMGFISNPQDEKLLSSANYQRSIAAGIAQAVEQYMKHVTLN